MAVVNTRNAVVGWITIKVGKAIAGRQLKRLGGRLAWRATARVAARATAKER